MIFREWGGREYPPFPLRKKSAKKQLFLAKKTPNLALFDPCIKETPNSVIKENFSRQYKTVDVSRRYGIKKLSGVHRRTKALKKLDMSRCQLSQNGFYELIPIILKSEHVILQVDKVRDGNYQTFLSQGNQITPLELKIFSGQLRYLWSNLFFCFNEGKKCCNTGQVLMCGK